MKRVSRHRSVVCLCAMVFAVVLHSSMCSAEKASNADKDAGGYVVKQITFGPKNHLFGYIGHARTIPWNESGRYIIALRSDVQDHMPELNEPADILLLDTKNAFKATKISETRGWNLQQGSMMYWNPKSPEDQFFFNDRDPSDGSLFTVLFDAASGKRLREYRFPESGIANSGVAIDGSAFLALNYGRLARCRLVTGYAGLDDWSESDNAPADDGIFKVDIQSGKRELLVSYRTLRDLVRDDFPNIDDYALFINHTLWNRDSNRIYFFLRANFKSPLPKVDVPFTINADGTGLRRHKYLGGHPEWHHGQVMILANNNRQVLYDTTAKKIIETVGKAGAFDDPGGDVAFSPNGDWLINGNKRKDKKQTFFTLLHLKSGRLIYTRGFPIGNYVSGNLRIDPAPCWNRESNQILFGAYDQATDSRQLFVLTIR